MSPAGFWLTYREDLVVNEHSNQGPWGGRRWIHWKSVEPMFDLADVIRFAENHGWECEESEEYSAGQIATWVWGDTSVFPLFYGFTGDPGWKHSHPYNTDFPRHIDGEAIVVRCDSGWIRVRPGTDQESTAFGYIVTSRDRRRMAVYHLWGEA